jgi:hypothetical protein
MSTTPQPQLDAEVAPFTLISAERGISVALDELIATGPAVLAWIGTADHDDPRREMLHDLGGRIANSSARLAVVSEPGSSTAQQLANGRSAEWLTDPSGDAARAFGLTDQRRMRRNRLREGLFVVDQQSVLRLAFVVQEPEQWIPASVVFSRLVRLGTAFPQPVVTADEAAKATGETELEALVRGIGERLGLSSHELTQLATASRFRDLGMSVVPDEIITKEGPLSDDEWAIVRRHPERSAEMLGDSPLFAAVRQIVRASHEHIDGSGYPNGVAGEQIPLGARILLVAESYLAIAFGRSYHGQERGTEPLDELRSGSGTRYDPAVLDALAAVVGGAQTGHAQTA